MNLKKKTEKEISTSYRKEKLPLFVSTQQVFVNVESLRDNLILIPGRIFGRCIQRYFYLSSVNLYTWVFILSLLFFFCKKTYDYYYNLLLNATQ